MKQALNKSLEKVIDQKHVFCFKLYFYTHWGITKPQLFGEMNEEVNWYPRKLPTKGAALLAIVPSTLLLYKLEVGENIVVYNPQRML